MLFVTLLHRSIAVFALNKAKQWTSACLWLMFVAFDCELITRPLSHDPEQPVPPSLPPPLHAGIVYSLWQPDCVLEALQLRDYQRAARPHSFLPLTHAYQHQSDTLFI